MLNTRVCKKNKVQITMKKQTILKPKAALRASALAKDQCSALYKVQ